MAAGSTPTGKPWPRVGPLSENSQTKCGPNASRKHGKNVAWPRWRRRDVLRRASPSLRPRPGLGPSDGASLSPLSPSLDPPASSSGRARSVSLAEPASGEIRYASGMEPTDLQRRLEGEVMEVEFDALHPHVERGAVFRVHTDVPLVMAALAVSLDLADDVARWLSQGALTKLTVDTSRDYDSAQRFRFIIVQPYVLIQPITTDPGRPPASAPN